MKETKFVVILNQRRKELIKCRLLIRLSTVYQACKLDLFYFILNGDPIFLTNCNLLFLVNPSSVLNWMDDLEFKHCQVKKSCMIAIHEREYVVQQRISYIVTNNKDEIKKLIVQVTSKFKHKIIHTLKKGSMKRLPIALSFILKTATCSCNLLTIFSFKL